MSIKTVAFYAYVMSAMWTTLEISIQRTRTSLCVM